MDVQNMILPGQNSLQLARQRQAEVMSLKTQGTAGRNEQAVDKAAKEFESVFLAQMLSPMMEQLNTEAPFGGGFSEKMYRSLLVDEYAKLMSESGGVGVADQIKSELLRLQEVQ